ncbi:hypothetical protein AK812_SmicGene17717 [Symbiodinium microadriaticum]|uniref:phosphatidate cytidylyltransferase n=2 Tax=Symbiodinium microadriaticum TaxID=2951 RepID=A0A1Q9DWZ1_SYMMI|nr:hypothetical protein AK812_SmicGene17717 [Symbiodinium microadriaticum]
MARGSSSSGRVAIAALAGLGLWAAGTAFVPSAGAKGLRGAEGSSHAGYAPFPTQQEMGQTDAPSSLTSSMQAVLLAAVFGFVVGLAPVRAEEEAAPAAPPAAADVSLDEIAAASKNANINVQRRKKRLTTIKKEAKSTTTTDSGKPKRVIISPADELDEDELSPLRPNPPLLILIFATPVTIYLTFYILGSLNIICLPEKRRRLPKYAVRVLMGFVLGEIMGPATFAGGWAFLMAYTGVVYLISVEYSRLIAGVLEPPPVRAQRWALFLVSASILLAAHCRVLTGIFECAAVTLLVLLLLLQGNITMPDGSSPISFSHIASQVFGVFYVGYLPSFWVRLRAIGPALPSGAPTGDESKNPSKPCCSSVSTGCPSLWTGHRIHRSNLGVCILQTRCGPHG